MVMPGAVSIPHELRTLQPMIPAMRRKGAFICI